VVVSRHGYADCIVHVKPFVRLHEVENPLLEGVKHADLNCMEKVGIREVTHNARHMLIHVQSYVNMV